MAKIAAVHLDKEVGDLRRFSREDRALIEELHRTKENLAKELSRVEGVNRRLTDEVIKLEQELGKFDTEIEGMTKEIGEMEKEIESLEKV